jgi:hypothetical protein
MDARLRTTIKETTIASKGRIFSTGNTLKVRKGVRPLPSSKIWQSVEKARKASESVIPAQAGIQHGIDFVDSNFLGPGFRRGDKAFFNRLLGLFRFSWVCGFLLGHTIIA